MPSNIKWRQQDRDLLQREVKRFNAAVRRMQRNTKYAGVALPEAVTVKGIRDQIRTRDDFNREINKLKRLFVPEARKIRTNKNGLKALNYVVKEMQNDVRRINLRKTLERKRLENVQVRTLHAGKTGITAAEFLYGGREDELRRKRFDFETQEPGRAFQMQRESIKKQSSIHYSEQRAQLFYNNYKKAMQSVLGSFADDAIKLLNQLSAEDLTNLYYEFAEMDISFIYSAVDAYEKAETIEGILSKRIKEKYANAPGMNKLAEDEMVAVVNNMTGKKSFEESVKELADKKPDKPRKRR